MNQATNTTIVNLPRIPSGNNQNYEQETVDGVLYLYYTIRNLNPNAQYVVWLAASNKYGIGDTTAQKTYQPRSNCKFFIKYSQEILQLSFIFMW